MATWHSSYSTPELLSTEAVFWDDPLIIISAKNRVARRSSAELLSSELECLQI